VYIRSLVGNILTVRLIDQESSRRGVRPRGVVGAQVFFATGDQPPGSFEGWHAPVVTLSSKAIIHLPYLPPGTKVWVTARWFNHRGETSVTSVPVSAHVGAMMIMPALAA
jgi:hypothetical protein